jgi:hypothetical protein
MTSFRRSPLSLAVVSAIAALTLSACNDNGSSGANGGAFSVSVDSNTTATSGQSVTINGYAQSVGQGVTTASWQQISGPTVSLTNANCAQHSASMASSAGTASAPSGAQSANYVCPLTISVPQSANGTTYKFRFTAADAYGNQQSAIATVMANPSASSQMTVSVGPNAGLYPGQKYVGTCQSAGGVYNSGQQPTYQFSLTGPSGVTPPAYTASGAQVQLTAPILANNTNFTLGCQVTDGIGNVANSTANLTVYGTASLPPLVANAGTAQIVNTATPVTLTASASANGGTPTAPVYYYWKQTGGTNTVSLANANTASASFVAPGAPSAPKSGSSAPAPTVYDTLTFTVYASYQPIDPSNLSSIPSTQTAQTVVTVIKQ